MGYKSPGVTLAGTATSTHAVVAEAGPLGASTAKVPPARTAASRAANLRLMSFPFSLDGCIERRPRCVRFPRRPVHPVALRLCEAFTCQYERRERSCQGNL